VDDRRAERVPLPPALLGAGIIVFATLLVVAAVQLVTVREATWATVSLYGAGFVAAAGGLVATAWETHRRQLFVYRRRRVIDDLDAALVGRPSSVRISSRDRDLLHWLRSTSAALAATGAFRDADAADRVFRRALLLEERATDAAAAPAAPQPSGLRQQESS
jgi:hypothetical protein